MMKKAKKTGLDIIAITDHNSLANSKVYGDIAREYGLHYIFGVEVQTAEQVHVIVLFDDWQKAVIFNSKLYQALLPLENDPESFGDQVVIDAAGNIKRFIKKALLNSVTWSFEALLQKAKDQQGFVFPAHVNALSYSIITQLGFIPENTDIEAVGISANCDEKKLITKYPYLKNYALIRNSDAHYLKNIGSGFTEFYLEEPSLKAIIKSCRNKKNIRI